MRLWRFSGGEKYPQVEEVILYGSCAKGNYRNGSDIDLVKGAAVDWSQMFKIELEPDDLMLPYQIDLACSTILRIKTKCCGLTWIKHIAELGDTRRIRHCEPLGTDF
ncbi:nucleotidyltransferase domain-containing protein [Dyadobacter psychrotolerans]|uniref:Nucleotidyltransferase domain-containing protein n=1 Tax=Dyadobacter psychrotolerans TaxID=2541721 RepID=A0A4R5DQ40_9BACT|nr:nucleotidyltransferase domain-containing protein [Dyadobacter psychrotolerans]TDE16379.1 nucleotidyltransferase domain-containing protein [Dyadobacter psychrotolerans]